LDFRSLSGRKVELSVMMRIAGKAGLVVAGAAASELERRRREQQKTTTGTPPPGPGGAFNKPQTGDAMLGQLAGRVAPREGVDPYQQGPQRYFDNRKDAVKSTANAAGEVLSGNVSVQEAWDAAGASLNKVAEGGKMVGRMAVVMGRGDVNATDAARVAGAGAKEAAHNAAEALLNGDPLAAMSKVAHGANVAKNGTYAAATTTDTGLSDLRRATEERALHEAKALGTQAALSGAITLGVGVLFPPAAPVVGGLSALTLGHSLATAADNLGRTATPQSSEQGAMMKEANRIAKEKAGF
jgi:hypothetical protein